MTEEKEVTVEMVTKFLYELDPMGFNGHGDMPEDHFKRQAKMAVKAMQEGLELSMALSLSFDHYFNNVVCLTTGAHQRSSRPTDFQPTFTEACAAWKESSYDNS